MMANWPRKPLTSQAIRGILELQTGERHGKLPPITQFVPPITTLVVLFVFPVNPFWRGRAVGSPDGLLNRRTFGARGFDYHPLRHRSLKFRIRGHQADTVGRACL